MDGPESEILFGSWFSLCKVLITFNVFLIFAGEFHLGVPMFGSFTEFLFIDRTQPDIFTEHLFADLP